MANKDRISAVFTDEQAAEVMAAIGIIKRAMPFLISTPDEDRPTRVMGPKSVEYVNLCLQGALLYPQKMTGEFDVEEYKRDITLVNTVSPVRNAFASVMGMMDDTLAAACSDSMVGADGIYDKLKGGSQDDGQAKDLVAKIALRFAPQSKSRTKKDKKDPPSES